MPCEDQTEILEMILNVEDQVETFRLYKMSCGRSVGDDSILAYIKGISIDELISRDLSDFVGELDTMPGTESFLLFKQFFSIRAALSVWTGSASGLSTDPFAVDEILYEEEGTRIKGWISVDLIHEEIQACSSCGGCATKRTDKAKERISLKEQDLLQKQQLLDDVLSSLVQG